MEDLVVFIDELFGFFFNLGPIKSRRIHPSEIPKTGGHSSNLLIYLGQNLPISLSRHGLGLSSSLGKFEREGPLCFYLSKEEDSLGLSHHSHLPKEEELKPYAHIL